MNLLHSVALTDAGRFCRDVPWERLMTHQLGSTGLDRCLHTDNPILRRL